MKNSLKAKRADPQELAGVKMSKRRYSISHLFHNPFPSVRSCQKFSVNGLEAIRCPESIASNSPKIVYLNQFEQLEAANLFYSLRTESLRTVLKQP